MSLSTYFLFLRLRPTNVNYRSYDIKDYIKREKHKKEKVPIRTVLSIFFVTLLRNEVNW